MSESEQFLIRSKEFSRQHQNLSTIQPGVESRVVIINDVLENLPISFFHNKLLIICGLSFMADSMEVSLLSFLSACAGDDFQLSDSARASLVGIVFVGELIGSLFWGPLADHYGRKVAFLLACCLISVFGFLSAFSPSYIWLFVSRAIVGFGVGGGSVPFDLLAEFLPGNYRGTYLISIQYAWTIGTLFAVGFAWLSLNSGGWRQLTVLTAIPVTLASVACLFLLPESPRWLITKGRFAEAEIVVRKAATECRVNLDHATLVASSSIAPPTTTTALAPVSTLATSAITNTITLNNSNSHATESESSCCYDLIATPHALYITVLLWIIWFVFGFTYYGLVLMVNNRLFITNGNKGSNDNNASIHRQSSPSRLLQHQHLTSSDSTTVTSATAAEENNCHFDYSSIFLNSLSEFIGVFICTLVIDSWGRVSTQAAFFGAGGLALVIMGLSSLSSTSLLAVSIIGRLCLMGASSATWLVTPELYPTPLRATGHSYCVCLSRLGGFLVPFLVISTASNQTIGLILGSMNMVALIASLMLPETKCVSLDSDASRGDRRVHSVSNSSSSGSGSHRHNTTSDNNTASDSNNMKKSNNPSDETKGEADLLSPLLL